MLRPVELKKQGDSSCLALIIFKMLCGDVHHEGEEHDRSVGDKKLGTVEVWENQRYYPIVGTSLL
jgi:hypothetical protein